jgi:uncharacterized BrkB/YihY/UPF0761 family membrane protein
MTAASLEVKSAHPRYRKTAWSALLLITASALAMVAIPIWIIQPFRRQTADDVALAYTLERWWPLVTAAALVAGLALVVFLWRGARKWWRKTALVLTILVLALVAWVARQNRFEWMFNPLPNAGYVLASDASFVADDDKVLSVEVSGETAAYPVRQMAYHHIVQDEVGGKPVVVTY